MEEPPPLPDYLVPDGEWKLSLDFSVLYIAKMIGHGGWTGLLTARSRGWGGGGGGGGGGLGV